MASSATNRASKAVKAIEDAKVRDAMNNSVNLIGNAQHDCIKAMTGSIQEVTTENVTHQALSIRNSVEDYQAFVGRVHKENEERMTLAISDVETRFPNHASLINMLQSRTTKIVDIIETKIQRITHDSRSPQASKR